MAVMAMVGSVATMEAASVAVMEAATEVVAMEAVAMEVADTVSVVWDTNLVSVGEK
jgi:hypothetical protein